MVEAFMQSIGILEAHEPGCFLYTSRPKDKNDGLRQAGIYAHIMTHKKLPRTISLERIADPQAKDYHGKPARVLFRFAGRGYFPAL